MQKLFQDFSFEEAKCFCCSVYHKDPSTGETILCDRKCVKACVMEWFTDVQGFDNFVRQDLYGLLIRQHGQKGLPYLWFVFAALPWSWCAIDFMASRFRVGDHTAFAFDTLFWCFTMGPCHIGFSTVLANATQSKLCTTVRDMTLSVFVTFVVIFSACLVLAITAVIRAVLHWWHAAILNLILSFVATALVFCHPISKCMGKCSG
mmetsp:Transcript_40516/g.88565  ORF Transcript_40516/g.88565 Transcript_40516/m.88565 type:complete len:205 (+) Transcript_40516:3-617(+)